MTKKKLIITKKSLNIVKKVTSFQKINKKYTFLAINNSKIKIFFKILKIVDDLN
jgi:hypothetical protein